MLESGFISIHVPMISYFFSTYQKVDLFVFTPFHVSIISVFMSFWWNNHGGVYIEVSKQNKKPSHAFKGSLK